MKKLFYLAFIAVLALSFGCATTDYPMITDTDGDGSFVVNTNGKATQIPTSQVITLFPDRNVELYSLIDQNAGGDQTIFTRQEVGYGATSFLDYTYCTPDWTGCWVAVADNPAVGDADVFDYAWNQSCPGADALSLLVSFTSRTGECGRILQGVDAQDLALAYTGFRYGTMYGHEGYIVNLNDRNLSVNATDMVSGISVPVRVGNHQVLVKGFDQVIVNYGPSAENLRQQLASIFANNTDGTIMNFSYNGILDYTVNVDGIVDNLGRRY